MLEETVRYVKVKSTEVRTSMTWAVWSESAEVGWTSVHKCKIVLISRRVRSITKAVVQKRRNVPASK